MQPWRSAAAQEGGHARCVADRPESKLSSGTMILHKLVARHLKHRDDACFYVMQAQDAIRWIQAQGVVLDGKTRVLDLGCGHGVFGGELLKRGCQVTFSDEDFGLLPEVSKSLFHKFN